MGKYIYKPTGLSKAEIVETEPVYKTARQRTEYKLLEIVPDGPVYTAEQRIEAVYLKAGGLETTKIAEQLAIPRTTINNWMDQKWWYPAMDQVMARKNRSLENKWMSLQEKALAQLEKLIELGDEQVLKDGSKVRRDVYARDLAQVANVAQQGRQKLVQERTLPEEGVESQEAESTVDKLLRLANALSGVKPGMVVDAEVIEEEDNAEKLQEHPTGPEADGEEENPG